MCVRAVLVVVVRVQIRGNVVQINLFSLCFAVIWGIVVWFGELQFAFDGSVELLWFYACWSADSCEVRGFAVLISLMSEYLRLMAAWLCGCVSCGGVPLTIICVAVFEILLWFWGLYEAGPSCIVASREMNRLYKQYVACVLMKTCSKWLATQCLCIYHIVFWAIIGISCGPKQLPNSKPAIIELIIGK